MGLYNHLGDLQIHFHLLGLLKSGRFDGLLYEELIALLVFRRPSHFILLGFIPIHFPLLSRAILLYQITDASLLLIIPILEKALHWALFFGREHHP